MVLRHLTEGMYLSHYTSLKNAISILASGEIWLSSIQNTNDPKELTNWELSYTPATRELTVEQWDTLSLEISEESKRISKIACFTEDTKTSHAIPISRYAELGLIGRGFANSPMWHFYGEKNTGCCLIFYKEKLIQQFRNQSKSITSYCGPIQYIDEPLPRNIGFEPYFFDLESALRRGAKDYSEEFLNTRYREIYFKKHSTWSYENEYRLFVIDKGESPFKIKYGDSLSFICLGINNHSPHEREEVNRLSRVRGASTHEITFKNHTIQMKNN